MNDLIKIDRLPSKHGSIYECLQGGVFSGLGAAILNTIAMRFSIPALTWIAVALVVFSGLCWFSFYNRFSESCRNLKHGEAKISRTIAYTYLIGCICSAIYMILIGSDNFSVVTLILLGVISLANGIVNIVYTVMFGNVLKKYYSGTLGEIGRNIITSLLLILAQVLFTLACVAIVLLTNFESFLPILMIITWLYTIFVLIYTYTCVWDKMVDIVEAGFFKNEE